MELLTPTRIGTSLLVCKLENLRAIWVCGIGKSVCRRRKSLCPGRWPWARWSSVSSEETMLRQVGAIRDQPATEGRLQGIEAGLIGMALISRTTTRKSCPPRGRQDDVGAGRNSSPQFAGRSPSAPTTFSTDQQERKREAHKKTHQDFSTVSAQTRRDGCLRIRSPRRPGDLYSVFVSRSVMRKIA